MDKLLKIVQKQPYVTEEKAVKKEFCTCGLSSKDPYCDGSHKGTVFSAEIVMFEEDKKVAWCGCKQSRKGAFCDGSNKNLQSTKQLVFFNKNSALSGLKKITSQKPL